MFIEISNLISSCLRYIINVEMFKKSHLILIQNQLLKRDLVYDFKIIVQKQFLSEGESGTITWNTQENLNNGDYFISHDMEEILEIGRNNSRSDNPERYVYNSDPTVSGLVRFQIKDVTPEDFGSYRGGPRRGSSKEGTFVLVYGKVKLILFKTSLLNSPPFLMANKSLKRISKVLSFFVLNFRAAKETDNYGTKQSRRRGSRDVELLKHIDLPACSIQGFS